MGEESVLILRFNVDVQGLPMTPFPGLMFEDWLPGKDQRLVRRQGNIEVALEPMHPDKDLGKRSGQGMVLVLTLGAIVKIYEAPVDLSAYVVSLFRKGFEPANETDPLFPALRDLSFRVYHELLHTVNRLLQYAKYSLGQVWLDEYGEDDPNLFPGFAYCRSELRDPSDPECWLQWRGSWSRREHMELEESRRYITQNDWKDLQDYVATEERNPDLVRELLNRAEWLERMGHRRAALTEAITALEVSVSRWGRRAVKRLCGKAALDDTSVRSAFADPKDIGLKAMLAFILPRVIPPDALPADTCAVALEAYAIRNNVVHNGQRVVKPEKLRAYLQAIASLAHYLAGDAD